jgi:hypothetical protein
MASIADLAPSEYGLQVTGVWHKLGTLAVPTDAGQSSHVPLLLTKNLPAEGDNGCFTCAHIQSHSCCISFFQHRKTPIWLIIPSNLAGKLVEKSYSECQLI